MNDIKFRAWDRRKNIFQKLIGFICQGSQYRIWYEKGSQIINESFHESNIVIERYTGLKDKNGKEIYEGNILETSNSDDPNYELVEWGTQEWQPDFIPLCDTLIVGNIHENPELLT